MYHYIISSHSIGSSNGALYPTMPHLQETAPYSLDTPVHDILEEEPELFTKFREAMDKDDVWGNGWKRWVVSFIYFYCFREKLLITIDLINYVNPVLVLVYQVLQRTWPSTWKRNDFWGKRRGPNGKCFKGMDFKGRTHGDRSGSPRCRQPFWA